MITFGKVWRPFCTKGIRGRRIKASRKYEAGRTTYRRLSCRYGPRGKLNFDSLPDPQEVLLLLSVSADHFMHFSHFPVTPMFEQVWTAPFGLVSELDAPSPIEDVSGQKGAQCCGW
jgi:hypothetical protein